jgi:hypothetical protein
MEAGLVVLGARGLTSLEQSVVLFQQSFNRGPRAENIQEVLSAAIPQLTEHFAAIKAAM